MEKKRKTPIIKRIVSCVSALALSVVMLGDIPVSADDTQMYYQYPLFAYSSEEGAITSNASVFCVNGNIATNGTIKTENTININGQKKEKAEETMPDISLQVNEKFFTKNAEVKVGDYSVSETNINLSESVDVKGKVTLKGNTIIGSGIKAMGNVDISGGTLHGENTVLFSEQGSIMIESDSVTLKGLIYAPQGDIIINAKSLSVDNVVMIANKITLNAPNININSNAAMAKFVQESIDKSDKIKSDDKNKEKSESDTAIYAYGSYNEETKSVDIEWYSNVTGEFAVLESMNGTDYTVVSKVSDDTKYSIKVTSDFIKKYFKVTTIKDGKTIESIPFSIVNANSKYTTELLDTDTDGLADLYEEMLGTDKTVPDTDKDGLTDYEEAYITSTAPTKYDSVTEGVSDADADNDKDGLSNKREIELKTDPNSDDTDGDTLKDGDEVSKYKTDPTKRDTDEDDLEDDDEFKFNCDPNKKDTDNNGIIDGKEKHQQTLDIVPDNKEQAVTKVSVSMAASGNIEKTTTVESIMNKDMLCSRVVGLVGEPFSIESSSSFDKATITFTVDKAKLGETKFDDLMFLWYDRENDNFVELETSHDAANSTVSIETTHFSDYMIVDSAEWWHNWERIYEDVQKYSSGDQTSKSTATLLFIKCSDKNDPGFINPDEHNTTVFHNTTIRDMVFEHLISLMDKDDVISFADNNIIMPWMGGIGRFLSDKTEIKKEYKKHLNYSGGSDELYSDIVYGAAGLKSRDTEDKQKRIIYITDHDVRAIPEFHDRDYDSRENFKMFYKSVPVYFVCIGDFAKPNLEKVASDTGGKVYTAATLNELYSQLDPNIIHPGAKHSDSDGFSDDEEIYGLIVDSSGTRYKTNPEKDDTDGDDLKDNEEVEVKRSLEKGKDKYGKEVYKWYHHMKSDPTNPDTDGDGINDKEDKYPLTPYKLPFIDTLKKMEKYVDEAKKNGVKALIHYSHKDDVPYYETKHYNESNAVITMNIIRSIKYNGFKWELTSGDSFDPIRDYINQKDPGIMKEFKEYKDGKETFKDPNGNDVELLHMMATLSGYYNNDILSLLIIDRELSGWAGDLQTVSNEIKGQKNPKDFAKDLFENGTSGFFSLQDILADIDADNINSQYKKSEYLSEILEDYYIKNQLNKNRYSIFVKNYGGIDELERKTNEYTFEKETSIKNLGRKVLYGIQYWLLEDITKEESEALTYGFITFIEEQMKYEQKT